MTINGDTLIISLKLVIVERGSALSNESKYMEASMSKLIQSVERALFILELFDQKNKELSLKEISEKMSLTKGTVHGLIKTLESKKYLIQNPVNQKYKLGMKLFELGIRVSNNLNLRQIGSPYVKNAFKRLEETVHLVGFDGHEAIYIDKAEGHNALRIYSQIGKRAPLYCTGVGKAILAFLIESEATEILNNLELKAFTNKTITDKEEIMKQLQQIRKQGFSIDNEEIEIGLQCIAAPIFDHSGKVIGSISTSIPKARLTEQKLEEAIDCIRKSSIKISNELGHDYGRIEI